MVLKDGVDSYGTGYDQWQRTVNNVFNLRIQQEVRNFPYTGTTNGYSRRVLFLGVTQIVGEHELQFDDRRCQIKSPSI
jgi:hypothetical protein